MNVILEGIDASGKTTMLKILEKKLALNNENYFIVNELEESPLSPLLKEIFLDGSALALRNDTKTSIYESLLLAALHFYKQEKFRIDKDKLYIYDRDFMTILAYQKLRLKKEYPNNYEEIFNKYKELLLFDLKKVDLIVYINVPIEISNKRIYERSGIYYDKNQLDSLEFCKNEYENVLIPEFRNKGIEIFEVDGKCDMYLNADKVYQKIRSIRNV